MRFPRKPKNNFELARKAGGTDYVPPACFPRAAYAAACVSAHARRTGLARRPLQAEARWGEPACENRPFMSERRQDES